MTFRRRTLRAHASELAKLICWIGALLICAFTLSLIGGPS